MSNLSPDLQQLVVAGRRTTPLPDADRQRLFTALQGRLGLDAGIASGGLGASVAHNAARALVVKSVSIVTATLAVVAGGIALVNSLTSKPIPSVELPEKAAPTRTLLASSATTEEAPPAAAALPMQEATTTAVEPKAAAPAGSVRVSARPRDSLSDEVAILSRAQTALHTGHADTALRLLADHERRFSRGILAEERTATKVQALCALARDAEANALLAKLSPQSLTGDSARQACTSNKKVTPGR